MDLRGKTIGFALTGSFCTFEKILKEIKALVDYGVNVVPIMSENAQRIDTRFGKASYFIEAIENMTNKKIIGSILEAEPIGTKSFLDALVIAPCTGNTLSKLANGITDTTVTMAAKANLRNKKPLILAVSTNDGLGANAKNLGALMNMKNIYMVPFTQDAPTVKNNSLVADMTKIKDTLEYALDYVQIQPMILQN